MATASEILSRLALMASRSGYSTKYYHIAKSKIANPDKEISAFKAEQILVRIETELGIEGDDYTIGLRLASFINEA